MLQTGGSIGPAGMVLSDDGAMYERTYLGLKAEDPEWILRKRGLSREELQDDGLKISNITDDTAHRGFWKDYKNWMSEN